MQPGDPLRNAPIRVPKRDAVDRDPLIFDTRTQAWKIHFPHSPEALDPDRAYENYPRQKSAAGCNLLELYERLRKCFELYQMEFELIDIENSHPNVIRMPYQFIEPQAGWKLFNRTQGREYTVRAVGRMSTADGPTFDGKVYLDGTSGPEAGDELIWVDPDGVVDLKQKLVRLLPADRMSSVMAPEAGAGDMAGSKKKPFTPMVVYELNRHEPGSLDSSPFGPSKQMKPRIRETINNPSDTREKISILGWWMDTLIDFKCVALTPESADRMTLWVRNFFQLYTSVLKLLGVQELLYWITNQSKTDGRPAGNLYLRNVQYFFRLEEITIERRAKLSSFNLVQRILDSDEEFLAAGETSVVDETRWETTHDTSGVYIYGDVSIGDG